MNIEFTDADAFIQMVNRVLAIRKIQATKTFQRDNSPLNERQQYAKTILDCEYRIANIEAQMLEWQREHW